MAFTTWAALYSSMLDDLATGSWRGKSFQVGDRTMTYRSFQEFRDALEYVKMMSQQEAGSLTARVYAKQGGRAS